MKVICSHCRNLVDEEQAIKMSEYEYRVWEQVKNDIPFITIFPSDYQKYVPLCIDCYKGSKDNL